jgi:hypothetical protein
MSGRKISHGALRLKNHRIPSRTGYDKIDHTNTFAFVVLPASKAIIDVGASANHGISMTNQNVNPILTASLIDSRWQLSEYVLFSLLGLRGFLGGRLCLFRESGFFLRWLRWFASGNCIRRGGAYFGGLHRFYFRGAF